MKRTIYIAVVGLILSFVFNYAYAQERITLSTYYPAPYGEYRKLAIGSSAGGYTAPTSDDIDLVVEGNVGIGTTTPTGTLHVVGGTAAPGKDGTNITLEAQNGGWGNRDGGNIILLPGTDGGPVGGADGNVGIGTTSPQAKLDIQGNLRVGQYTLPSVDGQSGQVLSTDGNGNLSWVNMGGGGFGDWQNTDIGQIGGTGVALEENKVYKAATDGFVTAHVWDAHLQGYTDVSSDPTTMRVRHNLYHSGSGSGITMPVKKDHYWKVTRSGGGPATIYWIPFGS